MLCKLHCPKPDGNGVLAGAAVVAVPAAGAVWLVTATPFLLVVILVLSVACAAGLAVVAWEVRRNWGTLWKPERAVSHAETPAVVPVRVPAALPARPPAAITAPRIVPGEVVARQDEIRATTQSA